MSTFTTANTTIRIPLTDSAYLDPVTELDSVADSVVLTPASYVSWAAMLAANPDKTRYLFTPGDYSALGRLTINNKSGTSGTRRVLAYYNPSDGVPSASAHPLSRVGGSEAVLNGGIEFSNNGTTTDYWVVAGLTMGRTVTTESVCSVRRTAEHTVWHENLIEGYTQGGLTNRASYTILQRNVFRNGVPVPHSDQYGANIKPANATSVQSVRYIDNEIYNVGNGLSSNCDDVTPNTEVGDWIIDGNDIWNSDAFIAAQGLENNFDTKTGDDVNQCKFINNRCWGLGLGDANVGGSGGSSHQLTFHRTARNWLVENNFIGENISTIGCALAESVWGLATDDPPGGNIYSERSNVWQNNVLYDLLGQAFDPDLDAQMLDNIVVRTNALFRSGPSGGRLCPTDPVATGNAQYIVASVYIAGDTFPCPYDAALNNVAVPKLIQYERKRFSGPEWKTVLDINTSSVRKRRRKRLRYP